MAKGRMINRKVCLNKSIHDYGEKYGAWAVVFHHRLLAFIDIGQNSIGDPDLLKAAIFPRESGITAEDCRQFSDGLVEFGLAIQYVVDGSEYLHWPKFLENQLGIRVKREHAEYPEFTSKSRKSGGNVAAECQQSGGVIEQNRIEQKRKEKKSMSSAEPTIPQSVLDFQNWFNDKICPISPNIPKCKTLNNERIGRIKARLRDGYNFEAIEAAVKNSTFLKNSANIDMLTRAANYAKLIEGNYTDKPKLESKPDVELISKSRNTKPALPLRGKEHMIHRIGNWEWHPEDDNGLGDFRHISTQSDTPATTNSKQTTTENTITKIDEIRMKLKSKP